MFIRFELGCGRGGRNYGSKFSFKVNFQFEGDDSQYFLEFSEAGLPVLGNINTFTYNANDQLIENTFLGGFGLVMPRSYEYQGDVLIGLDLRSQGATDGLFIRQGDILYEEGNTIIHALYQEDEIYVGIVYSFATESYNHITSFGYFDGEDSNNLYKWYDYEYDDNNNLVWMNEYDIDETTGEQTLSDTYDIEYDTKLNPFYKFQEHHPIVFNLLSFDFDSQPSLTFLEPHLRRNAKHNVLLVERTSFFNGNTSTYNFTFEYEYNEDDYPTMRNRFHNNGSLLNSLNFEYY